MLRHILLVSKDISKNLFISIILFLLESFSTKYRNRKSNISFIEVPLLGISDDGPGGL